MACRTTKPTVLQTAGKATLTCGNASSRGNFTSYPPGTISYEHRPADYEETAPAAVGAGSSP